MQVKGRRRSTLTLCLLMTLVPVLFSPLSAVAQNTCTTAVRVTPYTSNGDGLQSVPIAGLQARLNRKAVPVHYGQLERKPLRAIIVLDASGSMLADDNSKSPWQIELIFARKIINSAPKGSMIGLLAFSGNDQRLLAPTDNVDTLSAALDQVRDFHGRTKYHTTPLWDSILDAERMLQPFSPQDAIIVFSDGGDAISKTDQRAALKKVSESGVRVFAAAFVSTQARTVEERVGPGALAFFTEETGGLSIPFIPASPTKPEILRTVDTIGNFILALATTSYEVKLEASPSAKPQTLSLKLPVKGARILYPRRVNPCRIAPSPE